MLFGRLLMGEDCETLAAMADRSTVWRWRSGASVPSAARLERIADALEWDADQRALAREFCRLDRIRRQNGRISGVGGS